MKEALPPNPKTKSSEIEISFSSNKIPAMETFPSRMHFILLNLKSHSINPIEKFSINR